jgi:LmbE family N-acetylglucosaminyl deacetylase
VTRSILAVFAHPDDETYATGATIARYASEGVRCSLYCATDGDAGRSSDIPVSSREELGWIRRNELRAASAILGIQSIEYGGYPDGGLNAVDPDILLEWIVFVIRRERPDVVITFGPEGAPTRHRDHSAISRLTTAAFLLADTIAYGRQQMNGALPYRASRLCYVTWHATDEDFHDGKEGQPVQIDIDTRPWSVQKRSAFLAHASQQQHRESFERLAMTGHECYFVAMGTPAPAGATDLFAGL